MYLPPSDVETRGQGQLRIGTFLGIPGSRDMDMKRFEALIFVWDGVQRVIEGRAMCLRGILVAIWAMTARRLSHKL